MVTFVRLVQAQECQVLIPIVQTMMITMIQLPGSMLDKLVWIGMTATTMNISMQMYRPVCQAHMSMKMPMKLMGSMYHLYREGAPQFRPVKDLHLPSTLSIPKIQILKVILQEQLHTFLEKMELYKI
ncbi:hypothetical protein D3C73_1320720 [compost metagenome]